MLNAYADESGDPGYEFAAGSSHLFVVGVLLPLEPEELINRITEARRRLGKPETFEFRFHQANLAIRHAFFDAILDSPWHLLAAIIDKRAAPNALRREGKTGLYIHALGGLALRSSMPLSQVKLHLDGTGAQKRFVRDLKNGVRQLCRQNGRPGQNYKEIRILNSTHPLIQCADMLTGAVVERAISDQPDWMKPVMSRLLVEGMERFQDKQNLPD